MVNTISTLFNVFYVQLIILSFQINNIFPFLFCNKIKASFLEGCFKISNKTLFGSEMTFLHFDTLFFKSYLP